MYVFIALCITIYLGWAVWNSDSETLQQAKARRESEGKL